MPFNSLLLVSLVAENHFSESGVTVSMTQEPGEKLLFFKMDKQAVRDSLHIDGHLCDGLVFYYCGKEKTFCLVEMKGNKVDTAVAQVINTYEHLNQAMKDSLTQAGCQSLLKQISWKACICRKGGTPNETKNGMKQLEATFGKDNYNIQRESDLGLFLRKRKKK